MPNLITVPDSVWTDEIFLRCPGASPAGVQQALHNTLREFTKQSGAWVVELWNYVQGGEGEPSGAMPFNFGPDHPFYDFQAMLETVRATNPTPGEYAGGNPTASLAEFYTIDDYFPWDILYLHRMSYFTEYTASPNAGLQTQRATRFIWGAESPNIRSARGSFAGTTGWPAYFKTLNERPGAAQIIPPLAGNMAAGEGVVPWVSLGFPRQILANSIPVVFERMWYEHILDGALSRLMSQQDKPYTNPQLGAYHTKRFRNGIAEARDSAMKQFNNSESGWVFPRWA